MRRSFEIYSCCVRLRECITSVRLCLALGMEKNELYFTHLHEIYMCLCMFVCVCVCVLVCVFMFRYTYMYIHQLEIYILSWYLMKCNRACLIYRPD